MCPTDTSMLDVVEALRLRGQPAPDDYAVTGYDGFGLLSAPYLGLTTFRQPVRELGRTSIDLLIDKIEGTSNHDRLVALRGVVVGRTTKELSDT